MKKVFFFIALLAIFLCFTTAYALNLQFGWDNYADKANIAGGGYKLKISATTGGPYTIFTTITDVNAASYTFVAFDTVYPGNKYYFVMTAFSPTLESGNSAEIVWNKPAATTTSIILTTTTTVRPTTTTSSSTTTTSIKPVTAPTGLSITVQ